MKANNPLTSADANKYRFCAGTSTYISTRALGGKPDPLTVTGVPGVPEIGLKVILAAAEAGDGDETGDGEARLGDGDEVGDGEARLGDGDASAMASGDVMAQAPESSAIA